MKNIVKAVILEEEMTAFVFKKYKQYSWKIGGYCMAYTALYRKYRPNTFSGVVGQDHIIKTMKNQIATKKVSHAYLLCGTRGTGKTSVAKIFARAINCLSPTQEGEPCNTCILCQGILEGRSVNVIEMDAASNNKVDDIREIREEVKYPPTEGEFKVYIIDEVHMLTNSAFNSLLKTLEEPPDHVIFILATTDPQKVPATILSRCQRFDFRRITTNTIGETLAQYLKEEDEIVENEVLHYIAQLGDGSMRDSLSILDQCLAVYTKEIITLEKVLELMGAVDQRVLFEMTKALGHKNGQKSMEIIEEIMISGRDMKQFVGEYLLHLRNFLMISALPDTTGILDLSEENREEFQKMKAYLSSEEALFFIEEFSKLQGDLKYASNQRILIEVELLRLCSSWSRQDNTALVARLASMERKIAEGIEVKIQGQEFSGIPKKDEVRAKPKKKPKALEEDKVKLKEQWHLLRNEVSDPVLKSKLKQVEMAFKEDDIVYLVCEYDALVDMTDKYKEELQKIMERDIEKSIELQIISKNQYEKWYEETYGNGNQGEQDEEFASLLGAYFPEAEFEE